MEKKRNKWNPQLALPETDIRKILEDLKEMEKSGFFDGVQSGALGKPSAPFPISNYNSGEGLKRRQLDRKILGKHLKDAPQGLAFRHLVRQIGVKERNETYKLSTLKKYQEAVGRIRILFDKISRGEITSNTLIRSIVGSFLDTFVKDRNLLLNLGSSREGEEDYLGGHALNLCLFSLGISTSAGYSKPQAIDIAEGALLADIGMMLVPESIRRKRNKLTDSELREVQKHPLLGLRLLEPIQGLSDAALLIPYQHHERIGGTGYPHQRSGNLVSQYTRIVSVADTYSALIESRDYRQALSPYQAMAMVVQLGGKGILDKMHIKSFLKYMSLFPLGSLVRLSHGRVAKVIGCHSVDYTKPLVSVLTDPAGNPLPLQDVYQLDLSAPDSEKIAEGLDYDAVIHKALDGF